MRPLGTIASSVQTAPAFVGPAGVSANILAWWDTSATGVVKNAAGATAANNDYVSRVVNRYTGTGTLGDLVQPTGGIQMQYQTNVTYKTTSGRKGIIGDGVGAYMVPSNALAGGSVDYSCYFVARNRFNTGDDVIVGFCSDVITEVNGGGNFYVMGAFANNGTGKSILKNFTTDFWVNNAQNDPARASYIRYAPASLVLGNAAYITGGTLTQGDASSSGATASWGVGTPNFIVGTDNAGATNLANLAIGADALDVVADPVFGGTNGWGYSQTEIAEVIIYSGIHSRADALAILTYLNSKWL